MALEIRFKRRASGGATGAPTDLGSAEPAYNMADGILYIGYGDDGNGNATSIRRFGADNFLYNIPEVIADRVLGVVAGVPAWVDPPSGGVTYSAGSGITITAGEIAASASIARLASPAFSGNPTAPTQLADDNSTRLATTAYVAVAISGKANTASPAFTGTPTAPTAATSTNNTQVATTAYVKSLINELLGGASAQYDTFVELQQLMEGDATGLANLTTVVSGKLTAASNLADLTDDAAARDNLGLGSMAQQNAGAVAITGGTIDNIIMDGGTF